MLRGTGLPLGNHSPLASQVLNFSGRILMQMTASEVGDVLVVTVEERRIDAAVAVRFKDRMQEVTQTPHDRVVLDLGKVEFLDSSGLGAVVGAMKQLSRGRQLDLAGLTPTVDKVFRITRMDRVFRIYPTTQAALQDTADAT
jgi:anti-sigma B factor antagonist